MKTIVTALAALLLTSQPVWANPASQLSIAPLSPVAQHSRKPARWFAIATIIVTIAGVIALTRDHPDSN